MNDDDQPTGRSDSPELGRFLRDEVPAPGPGYWDAIDERLAAIGRGDVGTTDTDGASDNYGDTDAAGDTDAEVIRLTDMTTRPSRRFASAPILVGAAAALILLAGFGFALTRGDGAQEVATDVGDLDTETTELDTDPNSDPDSDSADGAGPDGTGPDDADSAPGDPAAIRYCYAGGELAEGVIAYADLSAPIETEPTVRIASRTMLGDDTFYEVVEGSVLPDGSVTGQFTDVQSGARFEAMFVFVAEDGLSLADDVFVEPVDCGDIAADIADIETTVNSVDLDEIAVLQPTTDPVIDFLPGEQPRLWTTEKQVEVRTDPGQPSSVVIFVGQIIAGTGRRAQADDQIWIELAASSEGPPKLWARESDLIEYFEPTDIDGVDFPDDDEEPRIWAIVSPNTVFGLAQPGVDDEAVVAFEAGSQYLVGTGRQAFADDQLWIQLEALPRSGPSSARSWVPRDAVEPMASELSCYASQDWESEVLVVEFDQDAESFTGTLILRISEVVTAEFFGAAGVRQADAGSVFTVNVQEYGSPEIVTEEWRGVQDGFSLGDRAFPNLVPCAFVADSLIELADYDSSLIPPAPDPAD